MINRSFPTKEDENLMMELYKQTPHSGLSFSPDEFVNRIEFRIYTEWCMDPSLGGGGGRRWISHYRYFGEAFREFVDNEVSILLSRQHIAKQRAASQASNHQDYLNVKSKVFGGLVRCAIDKFRKYELEQGRVDWANGDNLRCNLQPWIGE